MGRYDLTYMTLLEEERRKALRRWTAWLTGPRVMAFGYGLVAGAVFCLLLLGEIR